MLKYLLSICVFLNSFLFSSVDYDYDIIQIGEPIDEMYFIGQPTKMHNNGYLTGTVWREVEFWGGTNVVKRPYIFNLTENETKILENIPNDIGSLHIEVMNHNGLAAGKIFSNGYTFSLQGTFIYDLNTDEFLDFRELPEIKIREGEEYGARGDWEPLAITNDDEILVISRNLGLACIYDYKTKNISFLPYHSPFTANTKGQWAGDNWFYDPQTGYQELEFSGIRQILENGSIIGINEVDQEQYNFLWNKNTNHLETLSKHIFKPIAANQLGQITSTLSITNKKRMSEHAYFWDENIGILDLGTLGGENSWGYALNDLGVVVGKSEIKRSRARKLFIWDKENGMRDLKSCVNLSTEWDEFTYVFGIDNQGYINGEGKYLGKKFSFLLVPRKK